MIEYTISDFKYKGKECKLLRTKGEKTSYPIGNYQTFTYETNEIIITTSCKIEECIKEDTDTDNNFYSWYIVSDVVRKEDKTSEYDKKFEKTQAEIDYLFMINDLMPFDGEDDNEQNV